MNKRHGKIQPSGLDDAFLYYDAQLILEGMGLKEIRSEDKRRVWASDAHPDIPITLTLNNKGHVSSKLLKLQIDIYKSRLKAIETAKPPSAPADITEEKTHTFSYGEGEGEKLIAYQKGNHWRLRMERFPYFQTSFEQASVEGQPMVPLDRITELPETLIKLAAYQEIWERQFGIKVQSSPEALTFRHGLLPGSTFDLTAKNPLETSQFEEYFKTVARDATNRHFRRCRTSDLHERGFMVEELKNASLPAHAIRISRPGDESFVPVELALVGEFSLFKEDPRDIINTLIRRYPPTAKQQAIIQASSAPNPVPLVDLIIDSSVFGDLSRTRGHGRTWLDLLLIVEQLPTVRQIILPSIVADWELLGCMPLKLDSTRSDRLVQVDRFMNFERRQIHETYDFLKQSARWAINESGEGFFIPGQTETKFLIQESYNQFLFYQRILEHLEGKSKKNEYNNALKAARQETALNMGEFYCLDIARGQGQDASVIILINDNRFSASIHDLTKRGQLRNSGGRGIGTASTNDFLQALSQSVNLTEELPRIGEHPALQEAVTLPGIIQSIDTQYNLIKKGTLSQIIERICPQYLGRDKDGKEEMPLGDVFKRGAELLGKHPFIPDMDPPPAKEDHGKFTRNMTNRHKHSRSRH